MIILLYGKDEFRSTLKLAEIKNKFLEKNKEGGTLFVFDFPESPMKSEDIIPKLMTGGLFSNKKLAVFKNTLENKNIVENEEFLVFVKKIKKEEIKDLTVVFWEPAKFEKKTKLAKYLLANSKSQAFEFLEGAKFLNWIRDEIKNRSQGETSITPLALQKLASFAGSEDLSLLSNEIEKLTSFRAKGEISDADIDLLVRSQISTEIFKTIDALAMGDRKTAVKLLHDHLSSGDDPFYLLSMYFYQFRNLIKVKPLAEKNIPEREIALKLKLHPYVVRKSVQQGRNFSLEKLKNIYKLLCEMDFRAKTGKAEINLALDQFIAAV